MTTVLSLDPRMAHLLNNLVELVRAVTKVQFCGKTQTERFDDFLPMPLEASFEEGPVHDVISAKFSKTLGFPFVASLHVPHETNGHRGQRAAIVIEWEPIVGRDRLKIRLHTAQIELLVAGKLSVITVS